MSNNQGERKLFDILPPPLEKITKSNGRMAFSAADKAAEKNVWNVGKENSNVGVIQLNKDMHSACLMKQNHISQNRKNEMQLIANTKDVNETDGNSESATTNNVQGKHAMKVKESPKINKGVDSKTKKNNEFNISSIYQDLILNKDEVDAVIEENDEFRALLENETITNFMDECLKDSAAAFQKYRSDKKVLKFIQLLLDYMCAKYSYQHVNNLHKHFTFEKRN